MRWIIVTALILAAGCSDTTSPVEPVQVVDTRPANIVVVSGVRVGTTITATFENRGGPGAFRMEIYGSPPGPIVRPIGSPPLTAEQLYSVLLGDTEGVGVAAGWRETVSYGQVPTTAGRLVIYSRNDGSVAWRETHRHVLG